MWTCSTSFYPTRMLQFSQPPRFFTFHPLISFTLPPSPLSSAGVIRRNHNLHSPPTCNATSPLQEYAETVIDDEEVTVDDDQGKNVRDEIEKRIGEVKKMLSSMEDGEISISAYDTAWVGLVKDEDEASPLFPSSLEWIANNQLPDGSWGDPLFFSAHDRIINTLACVIALTSWNLHPHKSHQGMAFLRDNLSKLEDESDEHMPIGFEVAFPSLFDMASTFNIQLPHQDSPFFKRIFAMRDLKLSKIPREMMHKMPTTLLHSLEGMGNLDWKRLKKLQSGDGSFLFSPSSTAFALMHTKDQPAFNYLNTILNRFNGGVPNVYPVDLFEHIWAVDRLERLGISRYFKQEIHDCITYVSRYWNDEKGICWARNSEVQDIDDTAMGFRLLRLHGHQVSANVFKNFEKNGEFFCFTGQSTQAVTGMFNLYRASEVVFPGEKILEQANLFSSNYLTRKRAANQLLDKWIINKDLPGEVGYALDVPWYASLPRLEATFYIQQYGGENDVWIGKTLYRMPYVNNNLYLELAKLDYNYCQALHSTEWGQIQEWYTESGLEEFGLSRESLVLAYYVSAASIFEPHRSVERLAWAKTAALLHTITSFINQDQTTTSFVHTFINAHDNYSTPTGTQEKLVEVVLRTLHYIASQTSMSHGHDIFHLLLQAWQKWMSSWETKGKRSQNEAELVVEVIILSGGYGLEELQQNPQYQTLIQVTNTVCNLLRHYQSNKAHDNGNNYASTNCKTTPEIESEMQQLVQLVLHNPPNGIHSDIKNIFLTVAKGFYYQAYFDFDTINSHAAKVLFQKVM